MGELQFATGEGRSEKKTGKMLSETVPRGIIEAKLKGPGPGRYKLPSTCGQIKHDYTQHMKPMFSFGKNLGFSYISKICSPGPVYCVDPQFTRHGKDGTAKYTQLGRRRDLTEFKTPGPGRYNNQTCHPQGERHAPKYSMGSRTKYRRSDAFPAPNSYSLPQLLGPKIPSATASNSYSMTSRTEIDSFKQDLAKTPGPARYSDVEQNIYKRKSAQYSMLARRFVPGDKTQKPGPGQHHPETVQINKPAVPKYSMGIRHSEYITPLISDELDNF